MNLRKLLQLIVPPEEKKKPGFCIVHVIGGPSDRLVLKGLDHGETTQIFGLVGKSDEYQFTTWCSQGDDIRLLLHKSFNSKDVFRLLLNEYCNKNEAEFGS